MGPAEIVASLKELCIEDGPRISTDRIVRWIDKHGGYDSDGELISFAKKMKARQYARLLMFEEEETGVRIKRLWSFRDRVTGERCYNDILQLPPDRRRRMIDQYVKLQDQLRSVRRAMADFFAGQEFFEFYVEAAEPQAQALLKTPPAKPRTRSRAPARS